VEFTPSSLPSACGAGYTSGSGIQLTFVARYGDIDLVELHGSYNLVGEISVERRCMCFLNDCCLFRGLQDGGDITVSEETTGTTIGYGVGYGYAMSLCACSVRCSTTATCDAGMSAQTVAFVIGTLASAVAFRATAAVMAVATSQLACKEIAHILT